jgi:hypothetical protein
MSYPKMWKNEGMRAVVVRKGEERRGRGRGRGGAEEPEEEDNRPAAFK